MLQWIRLQPHLDCDIRVLNACIMSLEMIDVPEASKLYSCA